MVMLRECALPQPKKTPGSKIEGNTLTHNS
jgi:hypothetical protein